MLRDDGCSKSRLAAQHSRPDTAVGRQAQSFAAKRWRAGCRGPRWAETRDFPSSTERSPREDGQGSVAPAPRASDAGLNGRRPRAGLRCVDRAPWRGHSPAPDQHVTGARKRVEAPARPTPVHPLAATARWMKESRVSRPIEGLDSRRAGISLRMSLTCWRTAVSGLECCAVTPARSRCSAAQHSRPDTVPARGYVRA